MSTRTMASTRREAQRIKRMTPAKFRKTEKKSRELPPEAFDETPRVALVLTDETMYLTRFDQRGAPVVSYPVRSNDVASALNGFGADTGLLPGQCLFWQTRKSVERIAIMLPAMVRTLTFPQGRREARLTVPLPAFVFVGSGVHYSIFALKERPTQKSDLLYVAPLPNVNGGGGICSGDVIFPRCSAATIHTAAALFFESMSNSDLSQDKVRSQVEQEDDDDEEIDEDDDGDGIDPLHMAHGRTREERETINLFQFLKSLEGKTEFPLDELIPSITLGELLAGGK